MATFKHLGNLVPVFKTNSGTWGFLRDVFFGRTCWIMVGGPQKNTPKCWSFLGGKTHGLGGETYHFRKHPCWNLCFTVIVWIYPSTHEWLGQDFVICLGSRFSCELYKFNCSPYIKGDTRDSQEWNPLMVRGTHTSFPYSLGIQNPGSRIRESSGPIHVLGGIPQNPHWKSLKIVTSSSPPRIARYKDATIAFQKPGA